MNASLLMQIVMVVVAVLIGVLYIEPTISQIKENQDATYAYQQEMKKVSAVNSALAAQVAVLDSLSLDKARALETYFPDRIDEVAVTRDIVAILQSVQAEPKTLAYVGRSEDDLAAEQPATDEISEEGGEMVEQTELVGTNRVTHVFNLSADFSYTQLKQFIDALALNNYPLFIKEIDMLPAESGFITTRFVIETYSQFPTTSAYEGDNN